MSRNVLSRNQFSALWCLLAIIVPSGLGFLSAMNVSEAWATGPPADLTSGDSQSEASRALDRRGAVTDLPQDVDLRRPVTDPPERDALPIGMTPEEQLRAAEIGTYRLDTPPPPGPGIRQCAEWEPVTGALVRYPFGLPYSVLREIAEEIELWVLVANQSEQNSCYNSLNSNGVNMSHVHFVIAPTNSIWTRDYGPQFAFDTNGDQAIIDHHYNRPRPLDDVINYTVGSVWGIPVYGSPLIHTGGNYMCDGHSNGFSSDLVYDENPGLSEAQVDGYMEDYLGIQDYHVLPDIQLGGIHHIDCWAKLLNEETILMKQVAPSNPDYQRIENNVATMQTWTNAYGRPYKIVRIYCQTISGGVAAYTNSIVLNDKVLVPTFNNSTYDPQALNTYRDAMPGYEVLGFSGSWLSDDAIHCRAMGIHDRYMLRVDVAPLPDTIWSADQVRLDALVDDRSEAGLKADSVLVYWRVRGQPVFQAIEMTEAAGQDSFYAYIPGQPPGSMVEYYVFAADQSDRRAARPLPAPAGYYEYVVGQDPSAVRGGEPQALLSLAQNWPNPFRGATTINFTVPESGPARLVVIDVSGREVALLLDRAMDAGGHSVRWDGRNARGQEVSDGIYFFRLEAGERVVVQRGVRIR